jgi:alpha-beta hydrolase superfamily lysophospholipase
MSCAAGLTSITSSNREGNLDNVMSTSPRTALAALASLGLLAACSQAANTTSTATTPKATTWIDQPVTFHAGGLTIYATYRHPAPAPATAPATATGQRKTPAVLLIAGSGPTDRNGNSATLPGPIDTLQTLADWLSADGVASLRYDKLGSGQTGLGPYASRPATIGIAPFEQEAAAALRFLARQPGVDPAKLGVIGHSEGALFALLLATGADPQPAGAKLPAIHALGLLEPLSERYLDVLTDQIDAQAAAQQRAGLLTAQQAASVTNAFKSGVAHLRATGTVPSGLPAGLTTILNPANALFLYQADRDDPAQLAEHLTPHLPVLVTCSNADHNVTCGEVAHLATGLTKTHADTDFVHLTGVDHVLKQDPTGSAANYTQPLPFSAQFRQALASFAAQHL